MPGESETVRPEKIASWLLTTADLPSQRTSLPEHAD